METENYYGLVIRWESELKGHLVLFPVMSHHVSEGILKVVTVDAIIEYKMANISEIAKHNKDSDFINYANIPFGSKYDELEPIPIPTKNVCIKFESDWDDFESPVMDYYFTENELVLVTPDQTILYPREVISRVDVI